MDASTPSNGASDIAQPEPQIVWREAFLLAGTCYVGKNEQGEIPAMWSRDFLPRMGELSAIRIGGESYGATRMAADAEPGAFEYLASVQVRSLVRLPHGMVGWKIPAQSYVVLPANDVPDLRRVFHYVYHEWLPRSAYQAAEGPMFELYPCAYPHDPTIMVYCAIEPR